MSRTESDCFGIFLVDWLRRRSLWSSPLLAPLHELCGVRHVGDSSPQRDGLSGVVAVLPKTRDHRHGQERRLGLSLFVV